ncbi:hypothetical protein ACN6LA_007420, partial [Streptomyces sp. SAS_269]|uniref:hypothetical protein n=1 Tax=Streptomyces sp. SAS_269 TaxID=3412749 RepID=UPI00403C498F
DADFVRAYFLRDGFFRHRFDTLSPRDLVEIAMHRALTAGIPAPRIAQLTGLDPRDIVQAVGD